MSEVQKTRFLFSRFWSAEALQSAEWDATSTPKSIFYMVASPVHLCIVPFVYEQTEVQGSLLLCDFETLM